VSVSAPALKTFIVKIGNARKSVGSYPDISLADARKRAMALKAQKPREGQTTRFDQAYEAFKTFHVAQKKKNTQTSYTRMIDGYYLPEFRHRPLESITHRQITAVTDALVERPGEHWHCIAVGMTFFKFCVRRRYITVSPMEGMQLHKAKPRDRVLTDAEINAIWHATADGKIFSNIVRLLLLTGQRRGEIAQLQTSWLKENEIVFPKEVTKNGLEHHLPLGAFCADILTKEQITPLPASGYIFFAKTDTFGPFNGWAKSKLALDKNSVLTSHCGRSTTAGGRSQPTWQSLACASK
jgi:integrase